MSKKQIYLDNAATTPLDGTIFKKMKPFFTEQYGNPSTLYDLGQVGASAVDEARQKIARFLACESQEVVFTSGATESNNWAILGAVKRWQTQNLGRKPHLITTSIEHSSVLNTIMALKKEGVAEVTILKVSEEGFIKPEDVLKMIRPNTVLISIGYANNEIGTIQPIKEIGRQIKARRKENQYPYFHSDGVQALNYLDCRVKSLGVDLLTLNGHKIYGPKGIGALYIKSSTQIEPLLFGGHQENGLRPGTENVAAIVGLGEAVQKLKGQTTKNKQIENLRDKLVREVLKNISETKLNGPQEKKFQYRLPNNANISFKRAEGESIVFSLGEKGICVSTASACASHSLKPSHVLSAIGLSPIAAHCSVRFSLGRETKSEDISYVLKTLSQVIKNLRNIAGK